MRRSSWIYPWALNPMTCVLMRNRRGGGRVNTEAETGVRQPRAREGWSPRKLAEARSQSRSLQNQPGPVGTPFRPLVSRTERESISVGASLQAYGMLLWKPQETTTPSLGSSHHMNKFATNHLKIQIIWLITDNL